MRARKVAASPLPPSAEGRITRLAAVHVKASCDLNSLLERTGLGPKDIEDARARIGVQNQITFLELASQAISDPLLGFHLAETFDPRELGLLYYVQASSVTLGEALACMARYIIDLEQLGDNLLRLVSVPPHRGPPRSKAIPGGEPLQKRRINTIPPPSI